MQNKIVSCQHFWIFHLNFNFFPNSNLNWNFFYFFFSYHFFLNSNFNLFNNKQTKFFRTNVVSVFWQECFYWIKKVGCLFKLLFDFHFFCLISHICLLRDDLSCRNFIAFQLGVCLPHFFFIFDLYILLSFPVLVPPTVTVYLASYRITQNIRIDFKSCFNYSWLCNPNTFHSYGERKKTKQIKKNFQDWMYNCILWTLKPSAKSHYHNNSRNAHL